LELTVHLDAINDAEVDELCSVNDIPHVGEVIYSLIFKLKSFKEDKEDLEEKANSIQDVQDECILDAEGHSERHQESKEVGDHKVLEEVLGSDVLEVDDLSNGFKIVEIDVLFIFDPDDGSEMVIVELNLSVVVFLDVSDLLSYNDFCKVNHRVLNIDVLQLVFGHNWSLTSIFFWN